MGLIVFFLIWYNLFAKSNPRIYRKIGNNFSKILGLVILLSAGASIIPSVLGVTIALAVVFCIMGLPIWIIYKILKSIFGDSSSKHYRDYYADKTATGNTYSSNRRSGRMDSVISGLTKSVPKRRKIVSKFSKKYDLNLTDQEIDLIVDSSYMSYFWEKEIFDMSQDYSTVSQWYSGNTPWLRAYLRVFPVQTVSSDYERQKQVCVEIFDEVFARVKPGDYSSINECIAAINNRYMTSFDETTFMIAYRFLEENGKHHKLPSVDVLQSETELERLMRRYDSEQRGTERVPRRY